MIEKGGRNMKEQKEHPFIASLYDLQKAKDRAALARLRRGLGKRTGTPEMYPYVVPYLPGSLWSHERYFLVASLFAAHPAESPRGVTMGKVFRKIWEASDKSDSIKKRFEALLSADSEDVGGHLRHAISLAKSRNVAVDYYQLFYDLGYWDHPDRFVQRAWAKDFWGYKDDTTDSQVKGEQS